MNEPEIEISQKVKQFCFSEIVYTKASFLLDRNIKDGKYV